MIDITIVVIYLLFSLYVGIKSGRNITAMREFAVSDQNYTTPILVATIFGTLIGGGSTLGAVEQIFMGGIAYLFLFLCDPVAKLFIAQYIVPRMEKYRSMISVGDIMNLHYGKVGRVAAGFCGFVLLGGLLGAQISASGYIFHYFTNLSPTIGILLSAFIVITYSAFGGVRAVAATDIIQFGVIIIAIPIIANLALLKIGSYQALFTQLPANKLTIIPEGTSVLHHIFMFTIFCIPFLNPAVVQRIFMAKTSRHVSRSLRIAAILDIPFYLLMATIALCVFILEPSIEAKLVFPYIIEMHLPVGIKGLAISGMIAVIMSTADSYLNAASISFVHDFFGPLANDNLTNKQELLITRASTIVIGLISVIASLSFPSILDIILAFTNVWGLFIVVPLYAAIFSLPTSKEAFVISSIAALTFFVLWKTLLPNTSALIPSMFINALAFVVVSYVKNRKKAVVA